jgi:hypothetical protein
MTSLINIRKVSTTEQYHSEWFCPPWFWRTKTKARVPPISRLFNQSEQRNLNSHIPPEWLPKRPCNQLKLQLFFLPYLETKLPRVNTVLHDRHAWTHRRQGYYVLTEPQLIIDNDNFHKKEAHRKSTMSYPVSRTHWLVRCCSAEAQPEHRERSIIRHWGSIDLYCTRRTRRSGLSQTSVDLSISISRGNDSAGLLNMANCQSGINLVLSGISWLKQQFVVSLVPLPPKMLKLRNSRVRLASMRLVL